MKPEVHQIETTNGCGFYISIAHVKGADGLNMAELPDEIAFVMNEYDSDGNKTEHTASITKGDARKLALVLMSMAE